MFDDLFWNVLFWNTILFSPQNQSQEVKHFELNGKPLVLESWYLEFGSVNSIHYESNKKTNFLFWILLDNFKLRGIFDAVANDWKPRFLTLAWRWLLWDVVNDGDFSCGSENAGNALPSIISGPLKIMGCTDHYFRIKLKLIKLKNVEDHLYTKKIRMRNYFFGSGIHFYVFHFYVWA